MKKQHAHEVFKGNIEQKVAASGSPSFLLIFIASISSAVRKGREGSTTGVNDEGRDGRCWRRRG